MSDLYQEDSNRWKDESKDERNDSVAVTLSHSGSAADKSFSEIMQILHILDILGLVYRV